VTIAPHATELLALFVIAAGPVPLGLALASDGPTRSFAHRVLVALLAWCALQGGVALSLGLAGHLALVPLLVGEVVLAVGGMLALRGKAVNLCPARPLDPSEWLVVCAITILGASLLFRLAAQPINEVDSLGYHLPPMARWVQAGALVPIEPDTLMAYYPYGWELLCTLFLLPFHEDFLQAAPNLVAWAVLGLAAYLIARRLCASRLHALAGTFVLLSVPVVRAELFVMRVDLALAGFFVAGVFLALTRDGAPLLVAASLVAGMKTSGPIYVALLAVAWAAAQPPRGGVRLARPSATGVVVVAASLAIGGFWYLRNWIELGNPMGSLRVTIGGVTLFPGETELVDFWRTTIAGLFTPSDPKHWGIVGAALWEAVGLPGVLLGASSLALLAPPFAGRSRLLAIVGGLVVATAIAYVTTPFSGDLVGVRLTLDREDVRYGIPMCGLLGATGATGATRLAGRGIVLLMVGAAFAGVTNPYEPAAAALLAVVWACFALRPTRPTAAAITLALILGAVGVGSRALREQRALNRPLCYGALQEVLERELPPGTAVAHISPARSFLLYGPRLTNRVAFVPALDADRETWLRTLSERDVGLVALGPLSPRWRKGPEWSWLEDPAGPFERVVGDDPLRETVVYRWRR
jgi:hypothetical protein